MKFFIYERPEYMLPDSNGTSFSDSLHSTVRPAREDAAGIFRAPIGAKFDALALAGVLFPFDDLNHATVSRWGIEALLIRQRT
jgi:hypothetical protein